MSLSFSRNIPQRILFQRVRSSILRRAVLLTRSYTVNYESKYAEKLTQRAQEKGMSVLELKEKAKKEEERRRKRLTDTVSLSTTPKTTSTRATSSSTVRNSPEVKERKDSSPVKPLSSILNLPRLLSTPHTPEQVSTLWNAYHMSRSGGSGRGYVCATIPVDLYQKMTRVAQQYPSFVVPISRPKDASADSLDESDTAYEFYYLQWDFHGSPPVPSATEELFQNTPGQPAVSAQNPMISTVLFTPLQEFKLRNTFATPYLVLTHYTDIVSTHGVVLLRGEITPSSTDSTSSSMNYMLSQDDAQRLCMAIQKFYLWNADSTDGKENRSVESRLLKTFHEKPADFKWEELLQTADSSI